MNFQSRVFRKWMTPVLANLAAAAVLSVGMTTSGYAQKTFSSPEAAMNAFGDAVVKDREDVLRTIFGNNFRDLIPPVDAPVRETFIAEWAKSHAVKPTDSRHAQIAVGDEGWTFPIPLVKTDQGWHFDTRAGAEDMRLRRIGRNELAVIQTMLAIYDAQREYAQTNHDGEGVLAYASRMVSSPGKHDGLYWPAGPDDTQVRSAKRSLMRVRAMPRMPATTGTTTSCSSHRGHTRRVVPTITSFEASSSADLPSSPGR